jgi:hypothetical protein
MSQKANPAHAPVARFEKISDARPPRSPDAAIDGANHLAAGDPHATRF